MFEINGNQKELFELYELIRTMFKLGLIENNANDPFMYSSGLAFQFARGHGIGVNIPPIVNFANRHFAHLSEEED